MATQTPTTSTAPLGSTARTNALLSESSKQTGVAAPTFSNASPSQVSTAVSTALGGNPHDAPGYNPATDPTSTAYNKSATPAVNTSQPSPQSVTQTTGANNPQTDNTQATTPSGIPGQPNLTGNQSQQAGQAIDQLKQKYGQALTDLNKSGVQSPSGTASGATGVTTALGTQPTPQTPQPTTTPAVDNYYNPETNPAIAETTQQITDFISPQATRDDLVNQMSKVMADQSELSSDKLQLMNIKHIMSGTAEDLRSEITAAGGFATESQVQALAVSRNGVLLKQATLLQDQVQSQQDQVANDTTLLNFEKDMANTQASQRMGILQYQRENYQYSQTAQRTSLTEMQKTEGWNGIYAAALATGDPNAVARINQSMGAGFDLATAAKNDTTTAQNLADLANKQANTANTQANTAKTLQESKDASGVPNPAKANAVGYNATGVKYNTSNASAEIKAQWGNLGSRNLIPPDKYNQAKAWWVQQGLKDTDFDSIFGGQKDSSILKQYN